jgi:LysM repeat protein
MVDSYVIQPNDALSVIAECANSSTVIMSRLNGIRRAAVIHPGAKIRIPNPVDESQFLSCVERGRPPAVEPCPAMEGTTFSHRIRRNEYLETIATCLGVEQADLVRVNCIRDPNLVPTDTMLRIPTSVTRERYNRCYGPPISPQPPTLVILPPLPAPPADCERLHIVRPNERIATIASSAGITVGELRKMNNLGELDIRPNQQICLKLKPPPQPLPPPWKPCRANVRPKVEGGSRTLFIGGGKLNDALVNYLATAKTVDAKIDLEKLRIVYVDRNGKQEKLTIKPLSLSDWMGDKTAKKAWLELLEGKVAQARDSAATEAQAQDADLSCSDLP